MYLDVVLISEISMRGHHKHCSSNNRRKYRNDKMWNCWSIAMLLYREYNMPLVPVHSRYAT